MKVNIKSLPTGYTISNGKVYREGGTTGDQSNYGLVGVPHTDNTNGGDSPYSSVNYSLAPVPRDEANLEAEKGETVLTDMNNDGNYELYDIGGNRHGGGGTPLSLPPQSFIYSDTAKMKLNKYELSEMGLESKKRISPAKVSKNYQLNNFISLLDNEHSDHITRDTAEYMLDKNKRSLSQLAFLQEARKKFDDGVPLAAYPYLQEKGINPLEFSQQMEQISAQEAEEKMMMQLPIEDQLQLLQMKKQQAMMMQQQQMAQQQQQQQQGMGFQEAPQQGMPPQGPPQGMAQMGPPQGGGMPPQGMMPQQPPMQQPPMQQPAMARRGGQISQLLPKAQFGWRPKSFYENEGSIQDNTYMPPINKYENVNTESGNVGEVDSPIIPNTEEILAQYQIANDKLISDFTTQTNANMTAWQNQMNSMIPTSAQQLGMLGATGATDPAKIKIWEDHINKGGSPPNEPDPNYTQAYNNIHGENPEYENSNSTPVGSNNPNITNVYNTYNTPEDDDLESNNYIRTPNQNNDSDQFDNTTGRAQGLPLDYTNTNSPYYVGSEWGFANGGSLPQFQDTGGVDFGVQFDPAIRCGPGASCTKGGNPLAITPTGSASFNPYTNTLNTNFGAGLRYNPSIELGGLEANLQFLRKNSWDIDMDNTQNQISSGSATNNLGLDLGWGRQSREGAHDWSSGTPTLRGGLRGNYNLTDQQLDNIGLYGQYGRFGLSGGINPQTGGLNFGARMFFKEGGEKEEEERRKREKREGIQNLSFLNSSVLDHPIGQKLLSLDDKQKRSLYDEYTEHYGNFNDASGIGEYLELFNNMDASELLHLRNAADIGEQELRDFVKSQIGGKGMKKWQIELQQNLAIALMKEKGFRRGGELDRAQDGKEFDQQVQNDEKLLEIENKKGWWKKNIFGPAGEYWDNNSLAGMWGDATALTNLHPFPSTALMNYMVSPTFRGETNKWIDEYINIQGPDNIFGTWPTDEERTRTFRDGGDLPSYQSTGGLEDESTTINMGNTTRPDLLFSDRNFYSEEDMGYHNPLGFEDVNVQKYTGMNLGVNPFAINKVPFGFAGNESMDVVDRSNTIANLDFSTGINVGSLNDRTRGYAEGRGGFGWGLGNTWGKTFPNVPWSNSMSSRQSHYLNPYLSGEAGVDFGLGNDESLGFTGSLNTELSPYGTGLGAGVNLKKGAFSLNAGMDNMLSGSPTTNFGASYTFRDGGDLPKAQDGKEGVYPDGWDENSIGIGNILDEVEVSTKRRKGKMRPLSKQIKDYGFHTAMYYNKETPYYYALDKEQAELLKNAYHDGKFNPKKPYSSNPIIRAIYGDAVKGYGIDGNATWMDEFETAGRAIRNFTPPWEVAPESAQEIKEEERKDKKKKVSKIKITKDIRDLSFIPKHIIDNESGKKLLNLSDEDKVLLYNEYNTLTKYKENWQSNIGKIIEYDTQDLLDLRNRADISQQELRAIIDESISSNPGWLQKLIKREYKKKGFRQGGEPLPRAQDGISEGDAIGHGSINFGNKINPDFSVGEKFVNNVYTENVEDGYMNSGDNTLYDYDGWNAGFDLNNLFKSGYAMRDKTYFDRRNNIFNVDKSLGFRGGLNNSRTSISGEGRAGLGFAQGVNLDAPFEYGDGRTWTRAHQTSYLNPYMSGNLDMDFDVGNNSAFGVGMTYDTPLSPYGSGLGVNASYKTGPLDFNIGQSNAGTNFGASYTFNEGGDLPRAQYSINEKYLNEGDVINDASINFGNRTYPDLSIGQKFVNNVSEDYVSSGSINDGDNTNYTYDGWNAGFDLNNAYKSGQAMGNKTYFDRRNNIFNLDRSLGFKSSLNDSRTSLSGEGRAGLGFAQGVNLDAPFVYDDGRTWTRAHQTSYLNPYMSGNVNMDIDVGDNSAIGAGLSYDTGFSPYGTGFGLNATAKKGPWDFRVGTQFGEQKNVNFGASYNFDEGGELPIAKRGKEVTYKGNTYSEKELNKLRKSKDPKKIGLYNEIMQIDTRNKQEIANDQTKNINATRENTAAVVLEDEVFTGGNDNWVTDYMAESPQAIKYREKRYQAYLDRREAKGEGTISAEEYHKAYAQFQEQNFWLEENLTQEERNTSDWDDGTNNKYIKALKDSGFTPLDNDMISHVQSGYIGGQALALTGDEYTEFMQSGVKDQSVFGLAISPEDGLYGNTTNDQRETYTRNESTEEIPCTNAEGMEAACVEIGGTWTPWNEETKTGCTCDKQIPTDKIPPPEKTTTKDTPFWLQDELGMANALDAKMSLKKRYPWAPHYDQIGIDGVFDDPTREIAAISEQAGIAASAATAFGGPQRAFAASLATQGKAMTAIADTVNNVHSNNIKIGNDLNIKNAEMEYKTQMLNNNELKQLYDNTVLTEENYDNSLRKANAAITAQVQNAYTNRANTANLNSIYNEFDIDPSSGGHLVNVNQKTFHADPNYVDPQTYDANYAKQIEMLRTNKVPEDLWPKYNPPGPANPNNTFAKQNANVITNSGYQGNNQTRFGRETGRQNRILRKGGQLRNWFSPLRGN